MSSRSRTLSRCSERPLHPKPSRPVATKPAPVARDDPVVASDRTFRSLSKPFAITPVGSFRTHIRPPGSKSLTNRALLLGALATGESVLHQPLVADDTQQMFTALRTLGFGVVFDDDHDCVRVTGHGGQIPLTSNAKTRLHLGNAGTAYRFLTAACCLATQDHRLNPCFAPQAYRLDGIQRMHHRPIRELVDALSQLGGRIEYLGQQGFPPLNVVATGLAGGEIEMPPTLSSQYISALLQVGPCCRQGLTLRFNGPVTSRPYVEMTMRLMTRFGAQVHGDPHLASIRVEPGPYTPTDYSIEPDASNASYFLAAAAIVPGSQCTIEGLGKKSLQGDVGFADVLHQMGAGLLFGDDFVTVMAPAPGQCLRGVDIDLNAMPDMAQTLAAVALFAQGTTTIRNVGNLRIKETDRMEAIRLELSKLGATVQIKGDDLVICPPADPKAALAPGTTIDTYNDHRMAMSFAVIGLARPGVVINDPRCVDKTFPDFFEFLSRLDQPPS